MVFGNFKFCRVLTPSKSHTTHSLVGFGREWLVCILFCFVFCCCGLVGGGVVGFGFVLFSNLTHN